MRQDSEQFIPHGSFLEPWAFVAQGVTGAAIERPFEGVLEDPAMDCFVALLLAMTCKPKTGLQAGGGVPLLLLYLRYAVFYQKQSCGLAGGSRAAFDLRGAFPVCVGARGRGRLQNEGLLRQLHRKVQWAPEGDSFLDGVHSPEQARFGRRTGRNFAGFSKLPKER